LPIAIIQNGTRKNARAVVGTVSTIIEQAEEEKITNPAVIVIGEVVSLATISEQVLTNNNLATHLYQ